MSDFDNPFRLNLSVESRELIEKQVTTLDGKLKPGLKRCDCCEEVMELCNFYVASARRRNHKTGVVHRNTCIRCWNKQQAANSRCRKEGVKPVAEPATPLPGEEAVTHVPYRAKKKIKHKSEPAVLLTEAIYSSSHEESE